MSVVEILHRHDLQTGSLFFFPFINDNKSHLRILPPQGLVLLKSNLNLPELGSVVNLLNGQPSNLPPDGDRQLLGPCNHPLPWAEQALLHQHLLLTGLLLLPQPSWELSWTHFVRASPLLGPQTGCSNLDTLQHETVRNMQVISRWDWFMVQWTKEYTKNLWLCYFSYDTITYSHSSYSSLKVQNRRKTQQ